MTRKMRCPFCSCLEDRVVDSREGKDGRTIRRRRECSRCGKRFTSYERIEEIVCMVVKRDGSRVPFDRAKVMNGLTKACEKRPVPITALEEVADAAETLLADAQDRELPSKEIGKLIMKRLRKLDQVAYVRFASVYRRFEDVSEFMDELQTLLRPRKRRKAAPAKRPASRRKPRR